MSQKIGESINNYKYRIFQCCSGDLHEKKTHTVMYFNSWSHLWNCLWRIRCTPVAGVSLGQILKFQRLVPFPDSSLLAVVLSVLTESSHSMFQVHAALTADMFPSLCCPWIPNLWNHKLQTNSSINCLHYIFNHSNRKVTKEDIGTRE